MNTIGAIVTILGGLVVIAGFFAAAWVSARTKGSDQELARVRADRDDYKSRVEFIEPRLAAALRENELLQKMHDPTARLTEIRKDSAAILKHTAQILAVLRAQAVDIQEAIENATGGDHDS